MVKQLLNSDEEYFKYCVDNTVGYIHRKYDSQCCNYDSGMECDFGETVYGEWLKIERKPISYRCLMVWNCDDDDNCDVQFVYMEDFTCQRT